MQRMVPPLLASSRLPTKKTVLLLLAPLLLLFQVSVFADIKHLTMTTDGRTVETTTKQSKAKQNKTTAAHGATAIPPSAMTVKYHEMWNHTASRIRVPAEHRHPFGPGSVPSLTLLERALHGREHRAEDAAVDAYVDGRSDVAPRCLLPDVAATRRAAEEIVARRKRRRPRVRAAAAAGDGRRRPEADDLMIGLPILNVGYPKDGSSTLFEYFKCVGLDASHGQRGGLMAKKIAEGKSPFEFNRKGRNGTTRDIQVHAQMDYNYWTGFYPQISYLDEMHEAEPNSTFVMNFRPVRDWIRSVTAWSDLRERMSHFRVPGLALAGNNGSLTNRTLGRWWCGHVRHLRAYVRRYPSHLLVELDLYDANGTAQVLHDLVRADTGATAACWSHANRSGRAAKGAAASEVPDGNATGGRVGGEAGG